MADFFSRRFGKNVWITHHAKTSMFRRNVSMTVLKQVLECGQIKHQDAMHGWVFDHVAGRPDNLICAAILENHAIIVKTAMVNWSLEA